MATRTPEADRFRGYSRPFQGPKEPSKWQTIKTSVIVVGGGTVLVGFGLGIRGIQNLTGWSQDTSSFRPNAGQTNEDNSSRSIRSASEDETPDPMLPIAQEELALHKTEVALKIPTPTSVPKPTAVPTQDPASNYNFCTKTPEPKVLCKVPYPPPPTPTQIPSCLNMDKLSPGDWCVWPTEAPEADPTEFAIVLPAQTSTSVPSEVPADFGH